jgi:hypothetical protein
VARAVWPRRKPLASGRALKEDSTRGGLCHVPAVGHVGPSSLLDRIVPLPPVRVSAGKRVRIRAGCVRHRPADRCR